MRLKRKHWIGIALGITLFLAAFGVAFGAVALVQVSQTVPATLSLTSAVVISGDNIALWEDQAKTQPLTAVLISQVQTQPPLRNLGVTTQFTPALVYIENRSQYNLRPVDPGTCFYFDGYCIYVFASLYDQNGNNRGCTCDSSWPSGWVMAPGDMWRMKLDFRGFGIGPPLSGDYNFSLVFGAMGTSGDGGSAPVFSISEEETLRRAQEGKQFIPPLRRGPRP